MTPTILLQDLKILCKKATAHFELPTSLQKGDKEIIKKAPDIYLMRLPNSREYKKVAPYILIQVENGIYKQTHGKQADASVNVFLTFGLYDNDEQEGAMMLLNVMDAVRIQLLRQVVIGNQFKLDTDIGLEFLIFREDTAPYYGGVITGTFIMPPIEREVSFDEK